MVWRKHYLWCCLAAVLYVLILGFGSSRVSLWVDELHTEWTISGDWLVVPPRAAAGNQSPTYYLLLKPIYRTLTQLGCPSELAIRGPSVVFWAALLVVVSLVARQLRWPIAATATALVILAADYQQLFYGTEARVYALLQLISLIGWLFVLRLAFPHSANSAPLKNDVGTMRGIIIVAFCGCVAIAMHLTAIPVAMWQCILLLSILLVQRAGNLAYLCSLSAGAVVCVVMATSLVWDLTLWERRGNWSGFAGEASFSVLLSAFPVLWLFVPAAICVGVDLVIRQFCGALICAEGGRQRARQFAFWLIVASGPIAVIGMLTHFEIAPLFHARYLICSAAPLGLAVAALVAAIRFRVLRGLAFFCIVTAMFSNNGMLPTWRSGRMAPWQRTEGWRQAARFVSKHVVPGESVWCASGLVEARNAKLPLNDQLDDYLSYPLSGCYAIQVEGQIVQPHALVNDIRLWDDQLLAQLAGNGVREPMVWIVFRGPDFRLRQFLSRLESELSPKGWTTNVAELVGYGHVSTAKVELQPLPD